MARTKKNPLTTEAPTTNPSSNGFDQIVELSKQPTERLMRATQVEDIVELTLPPNAPPRPSDPEVGDVIQVVHDKSKFMARVAVVHSFVQNMLLCYQPRGTLKPESFRVKPSEVVVIGKAKLKWKKEL